MLKLEAGDIVLPKTSSEYSLMNSKLDYYFVITGIFDKRCDLKSIDSNFYISVSQSKVENCYFLYKKKYNYLNNLNLKNLIIVNNFSHEVFNIRSIHNNNCYVYYKDKSWVVGTNDILGNYQIYQLYHTTQISDEPLKEFKIDSYYRIKARLNYANRVISENEVGYMFNKIHMYHFLLPDKSILYLNESEINNHLEICDPKYNDVYISKKQTTNIQDECEIKKINEQYRLGQIFVLQDILKDKFDQSLYSGTRLVLKDKYTLNNEKRYVFKKEMSIQSIDYCLVESQLSKLRKIIPPTIWKNNAY